MTSSVLSSLEIKPQSSASGFKILYFSHITALIMTLHSGLSWEMKAFLLAGLIVSILYARNRLAESRAVLSFYDNQWHFGTAASQTPIRQIAIGFDCPWFIVLRIQRYRRYEKILYFHDQLSPETLHQLKTGIAQATSDN